MQRKSNIAATALFARFYFYVILITIASGCTATRFLKDDETFYREAEIRFETTERVGRKNAIRRDLETFIYPKPNKRFLGMRPSVWFYYIAGTPKKKKGLKSFIRNKLGSPPVLLKDA